MVKRRNQANKIRTATTDVAGIVLEGEAVDESSLWSEIERQHCSIMSSRWTSNDYAE